MLAKAIRSGQSPRTIVVRCLRRLANAQAGELKKLGVRGTIANGVARFEAAKAGQPPPVWFVFSGARLCCP